MHDTILLTHIFFYFYSIVPLIPLHLHLSGLPPPKISTQIIQCTKSGNRGQITDISSLLDTYLPICVRISTFFFYFFLIFLRFDVFEVCFNRYFDIRQKKQLSDVRNKYKRRKTVIKTFKNRLSNLYTCDNIFRSSHGE